MPLLRGGTRGIGGRGVWCCLDLAWGVGIRWSAPRGAASLRVWRSTSNLFAVIAVRANTLESSNSLFYFSHHEGDHLSSRLPALPAQPLASGLSRSAQNMSSHPCMQRHKCSVGKFFVRETLGALMHHTFARPALHDSSSRGHERSFYEVPVRMNTAR